MKNIHILPTDKPSRLFIDIEDNKLKITIPIGGEHMMNQNIYITNDEEIKEGDYCISHLNIIDEGKIHNSQTIFNPKTKEHLILLQSCKKIILTTNTDLIKDGVQPIDDDFLEWFVKNPSCEEVKWNAYPISPNGNIVATNKPYPFEGLISNFKIEYKIIIPKEEPKQCCDSGIVNDFCINTLKCKHAIEEPKQLNSEDFGLPKFGTKEFNDLASGLFGGKPKQEKLTYTESAKKEERISNCTIMKRKQEIVGEVAERYASQFKQGFIDGVKWQQEKQDDFIIGFLEFIEGTYSYSNIFDHWYLHSDTSKTYSKKQLLKIYLKRNKL